MHNPQSKSFFRGGGLICSSQVPQESNFLDESFIDYEMIKSFFLDLDGLCQDINEQSKSIQSEECQEKILKIIRSIQYQSQFINQTSRNYIKTREYIRQVQDNIEILLDSITNTIVSSRFITLQILKVCNQLSRLIFQYYAHDQSIPLDLDRQQSILSVITQIQTLLNQGGEQLYYNSICYEIYIIQICIEICPTNSEESKEVLLAIISGIQAQLEELSTDLLSALAQGGLFVYKQIKQRKQRNIFQIIFYLEEFKFRIIEKIQQGQGINKIIKQLANNYNLLVKNSTEWLIKCSWIKLMSDLIIYKPVITLKQFQIIKSMNQLPTEWDTLVQKKMISLVEQKKQIGIILQNDENSNINRILQQQVIKFQYLQNCIINGDRQLPKIEQLKEFQQQQQKITNEQTNLIIQELQNLPIEQFLHQLTQYSQQIIKSLEVVQDFKEDMDNQTNNQQYLLTQIEHIISENDNLDNSWFQLIQNNNIVLDFLENIVKQLVQKEISKKSQINLVINQVISNFELQKLLEIKQDDLESEYQSLLNQLQITYEFNEQTQQLLQIIKNGLSFASLDTLIIQLQEFNTKYKFVCTLDDIYYQINIINVIIKQITQTRESLISLKMDFINIKSFLIANIFDWVKLRQFCQKQDYFKISCIQYSFIISLNFIYTQINQNQQLLISNILLIQNQEFSIGVNLSALQVNNRLQDVLLSLSIIGQQQSNQFAQLNNLDDRIQYLTFLQQIYIYADMKINQEISNLKNLIMSVDSLYTEQDSQNQNSIIIDQIIANYHQLSQEIDSELFIEYIQKRINLIIQLEQYQIGDQKTVMNDLEMLSLIIEDLQQKYSNISKEDVLQTLKIQQEKIIDLQLNFKEQSVTNRDKSSILNLKIYFLSLKQIIEQLNIYKFKDNQNNITHEINSMINYLKLQKHLKNQLDENYCHKYNQIQDSFQQIYQLDLDKHQQEIQQQFKLLLQQDVKLSIDQVKVLIPSYQQLINIVIETNTNQLSIKQKAIQFLNDAITSDEWRIKDYLYFNCFIIHKSLNESNQKIVGNLLLMARFQEIDYRVINTLKGKEQIIQMEEIINNQWEETQDQVVNQLQLTLNELQAVQLSLQSEERKEIRNQLLTKHKTLEQQLEQQMKNADQIGDMMGITIYFLKDIKRDLQLIQSKLDLIINSIEQIGQDIKFLRGKTPQQILEIRMQNVLQNKIYSDAQSVYVQMKTLEFDFLLNQDKSEQTPLFNSDSFENGEIDEFLKENTKSSLLIHGAAGSGKSLTARKIEEYLWLQYEKQIQNQKWDEVKGLSPLIPIFIQLPTLQDPKFNAIEETLLSSLYRFDQKQIELLRETAQQNKIRLIFIMDSYDELPQQYQGINLLQTNKIHLWKPQNQLQIPKVITTSRTEAFKTNDYRAWFWENEIQGTKSLKELRLLQFNDDQRQTYIEQFSILKLKIQLYDLLQVIDKTQEKDQIFLDVEDIWRNFQKTIQINISKGNRQFLLDKRDISIFINLIKSNQNIIAFNQELETSFTKIIQKLWHQNLYNSSIQQLNLSELLDNPFMLNIIIEVIPLMNSIVSKPNHIKQYFIANFQNNYSEFLEETVQNNQQKSTYQMTQEQIKYIHDLLNNQIKLQEEVMYIWEQLINNNFFSSWSIQSTYDETIELLQNFKENLFRVPFLEDLLIILYKSLKSKKLTVFDFFETFIDQFVENQRQKLIYSSDIVDQNQFQQDIYQYAVKLAAQMFQRQETIIERKAQGILFRENSQDPYLQFFEDSDQFGNYRKQIRKCLPIRQKGNYFQFLHKSIQEFLFAKQQMDIFITSFTQINHIQKFINHYRSLDQQLNLDHIDFFEKKQNLGQDELKYQEILTNILMQLKDSILNSINLQDTFNLGTLKFMRAKFIQELNLYQILETFVLLSSINQSYLRFSSNCLIILLSVQQYQFNKDFSKIRISDISLDGAIFEQCNLSYSKFEKVSIKGISLNYSDISNCEWNQMYSYELPSIKIEGQNCFSWVSPKDDQLLTFTQNGPTDSQIQIWDYKEGEQIQSLKNPCVVYFAQYSNTGEYILSYGADQIIRLWSTASYTQIKEKQINEKFQRFTFSDDDQKIAFCSQNRVQIINNIETMQFSTIQLNECLGFTFEQNAIITLNYQNQSQISLIWWDTIKGTQLKKLSSVLINPDKKLSVVIFNNGYIFISRISVIEKWDIKEFKQQGPQFKGHSGSITFMDVSKNGKLLVSCSWDKRIIVYDIKSCNALSTLLGHSQVINIVQFSPSSKFLISCSNDQEVRFWDLKFNESIQSQKIKDIQFSPDSKEVVCFSNNEIQFFSTKTGQQTNKLIEKIEIKCVALHPNGKYLLYSNENQIKTLDIRLLKQVGESKFTEKPILKLGYSSDGNKIFVALDPLPNEKQETDNLIQNQKIGGLVEIYNLNWELIHNYNCSPLKTITLSSNNEYLMDFDMTKKFRSAIQLFEFNTFQSKLIENDTEFNTFCLSDDSEQFIGLEYRNILKIWNLSDSKLMKKTQIQHFQISHLVQSFDKSFILCGTQKGYIIKFSLIADSIEKVFEDYQTEIDKIILSKNQLFFTAISNQPILILWQRVGQDDYYVTKYINPNRLSQNTLLFSTKLENVKITNHLDYDLGKLFQNRFKSQNALKLDQAQKRN